MTWTRGLFVVGWLVLTPILMGQQATKPAIPQYTPTELQRAHLHEAQLEAQLAQVALQQAQRDFQDKLQALRAAGEQVKKENHWADDVQFDIANLTYSAPAPAKGAKP